MRERVWAIIAAIETLGGITGLISAVAALDQPQANAWSLVLIVAGGGLYGLSLVAGVMLFRGHVAGRFLSTVVQATQVVQLATGPVSILIRIGVAWTIGFRGVDAATSLDLGSEFRVSIGGPEPSPELMVNLLACLALYSLLRGTNPGLRPSNST